MEGTINTSLIAGAAAGQGNLFAPIADYPEPFHVPVRVKPDYAYRYRLARALDYYIFPGTHEVLPTDRVDGQLHPSFGWKWDYNNMLHWAQDQQQTNSPAWRGTIVETMWDEAHRVSRDAAASRNLGHRLYHHIFVPAPVYMASEDPNDNPCPEKYGYVLYKHPSGGHFYLCYGEHTHPDPDQISSPSEYTNLV